VEEGSGGCDGRFEVLCQPAVAAEPGEASLDDPAARMHGEADLTGRLANDLDGDAGSARHPVAGTGVVGESEFHKRDAAARGTQQGTAPSRHAANQP
jgi:hypothetical protein